MRKKDFTGREGWRYSPSMLATIFEEVDGKRGIQLTRGGDVLMGLLSGARSRGICGWRWIFPRVFETSGWRDAYAYLVCT